MKSPITAIALILFLLNQSVSAKKSELYSSKYYVFQSSLGLNAHLFLYNKAVRCKFENTHNDSLAYYALKDKWATFSLAEQLALNKIIRFYRDSLLKHDLLFDSLMRNFEDLLSADHASHTKLRFWQVPAFEALHHFQPFFVKAYWPAIDSLNKAWLLAHKGEVTAMETATVPELEKIFKTKLPEAKIKVDLCCFATWAGAYSYLEEGDPHIIFSTRYAANQSALATEVVFHETAHFLADKLEAQIKAVIKSKNLKCDPELWHKILFYTTGFVLEKEHKLKWEKYDPYYLKMKFEEKSPEFKSAAEACRLFWNPYLNGDTSFEEALTKMVTYLAGKP